MEASTAFVNVISEDIGFKSNVNGPCCDVGKLCIKHEKLTGSSMGETAMAMSLEDAEGTSITIEDSLMVGLGTALHDILHVQDVPTGADVHVPTSSDDEIWRLEKHKMCPELEIHNASASVAKTQKSLSKCATFPSLEEKLSSPVTLDGKEELPSTEQHGQSSLKPEDPTCTRSMSMPVVFRGFDCKRALKVRIRRSEATKARDGLQGTKVDKSTCQRSKEIEPFTLKRLGSRPKCKITGFPPSDQPRTSYIA